MVERIARQLAQANENLTANVLKTILTASKVKEQICMHEVHAVISYSDYNFIVQMFTYYFIQ